MSDTSSAEKTAIEHLRIIRTLMERAHIYRAVSAPAALVGGILALTVSSLGYYHHDDDASATKFLCAWLLILVVCTVLNLFLLIRESKGQHQPFLTDGLRMALRAVIPPLTVGGFLGICLIIFKKDLALAALIWILCYGLALLSTSSFAPKSVTRLGGCFLVSGIALTVSWFMNGGTFAGQSSLSLASLFLGLTFGAGHIAYSLAVFFNTPKTSR
ncbi:hypothetical protein BH11VER1_BH11VER1_34380 [soil metagenome]